MKRLLFSVKILHSKLCDSLLEWNIDDLKRNSLFCDALYTENRLPVILLWRTYSVYLLQTERMVFLQFFMQT